MANWDAYSERVSLSEAPVRQTSLDREAAHISNMLPSSMSYFTASVNGANKSVAIINSDNLNEKTICSMPGEDIAQGSTVYWEENYWLVTEKDANNELYARCKMIQCNYLLKWVTQKQSGYEVVSRHVIIEDGTKYLTGEYGDNQFVLLRGDSRIQMTISKDSDTSKLGRDQRFIIDDYDSPDPLAYRLTKPFKMGGTYNNQGVYRFVLSECTTEDTDDLLNHIPNYYKYFPRSSDYTPSVPGAEVSPGVRRVYI